MLYKPDGDNICWISYFMWAHGSLRVKSDVGTRPQLGTLLPHCLTMAWISEHLVFLLSLALDLKIE